MLVGGLGTLPELEEPQALVLEEDGSFGSQVKCFVFGVEQVGGWWSWINVFCFFFISFFLGCIIARVAGLW